MHLPDLLISPRVGIKLIYVVLREVFCQTDSSIYWKTYLESILYKVRFKRGFNGLVHPSLKPCPPLYARLYAPFLAKLCEKCAIYAPFSRSPRSCLPSQYGMLDIWGLDVCKLVWNEDSLVYSSCRTELEGHNPTPTRHSQSHSSPMIWRLSLLEICPRVSHTPSCGYWHLHRSFFYFCY